MADDAQNVREDGGGVAGGAADAVVGGQPANEVPAAEAQGVVGGTPDGGTGEDGLAHVEENEDLDGDLDEDADEEEGDDEDEAEEGADTTVPGEGENEHRDDQSNGPFPDTDKDAIGDVEVARYRITGLVDHFDEQNNIQGQFAVGSVQELPVEYGDRMVEEGQAERVEDNDDEVE